MKYRYTEVDVFVENRNRIFALLRKRRMRLLEESMKQTPATQKPRRSK